jgi:hypothetical protein
MPYPHYFTPGKEICTHCTWAGWASRPVCMGMGSSAPTGIQSPDHPSGSESLFQLSYPGPSTRGSNDLNLHEGWPTFLMKES